jgi:predicted enzyme related to lactoylglutathione lyase
MVLETFFSVLVADMQRATTFYCDALGATVSFAAPGWTSLHLAGVRVGLALVPGHAGARTGLHFAVADLAAARAAVLAAGGRVLAAELEPAPGVVIAEMADPDGNSFVLARR